MIDFSMLLHDVDQLSLKRMYFMISSNDKSVVQKDQKHLLEVLGCTCDIVDTEGADWIQKPSNQMEYTCRFWVVKRADFQWKTVEDLVRKMTDSKVSKFQEQEYDRGHDVSVFMSTNDASKYAFAVRDLMEAVIDSGHAMDHIQELWYGRKLMEKLGEYDHADAIWNELNCTVED